MGKKNKLLFVAAMFMSLFVCAVIPASSLAGIAHTVWGSLENSDQSTPADGSVTFSAYIEGRTDEVITHNSPSSDYQGGTWFLDLADLKTDFADEDILIVNFQNTDNNEIVQITIEMDANTGAQKKDVTLEMPPLLSIAVTPEDPSVAVPNTLQLTAMGTYEGVADPIDITSSVTWNSENSNAGSIDGSGVFTPDQVGTTKVTAFLNSIPSNEITVTVATGEAANVAIDSGDNQTGEVGSDLSLSVLVTDAKDNPVSGADVAWEITTSPANGAELSAPTTKTDANGKATVVLTLGTVNQDYTTTATVGSIAPVPFTSTATPGPLASYTVAFAAFDATAGMSNDITITAKDAADNTITDHTGTITVTATDDNAELPGPYTFVAGDNGVKTLSVTLKTAGEQTITVTNGDISGTVDGTVVPAAAAKIDLTASATTVASGGTGTADLTATVQDAFGNTVKTEAGDVTYTVTGADTSNAGWTNETATLADGMATKEFTTQGTVGGDGSAVVTVTASKAGLTDGTIDLTIVNFSVSPANTPMAKIGDTINLKVEGALGDVTWKVTGDAGVGSLVTSGVNNENAVFTVKQAGTATIEVTEGDKNDAATVTAYYDVAVTDKPDSTKTIPSGDTVEFKVTGGDNTAYTWKVTPPVGDPVKTVGTGTYSFKAPSTGNFAGTYKIEVTDNVGFGDDSFEIYVPLQLEPDLPRVTLLSNANPYPFTLTGAADTTSYTVTVESFDDDPKIVNKTSGMAFAGNMATYAFDPQAYTVTADTGAKEYSLWFEVQDKDLTDPDSVDIRVAPATLFTTVKTGGEADFTATAPKDVKDMFGSNPIKLKIAGDSSGKTIDIAVREPVKYKNPPSTVTSAVRWEIVGLEKNACVTIPVPCTEAEAREVNAGTKAVFYMNDNTPDVWKKVDPSKIVNIAFNGNNSLIEVEICEWSSNVVGIGSVSSDGSSSDGSSSDGSSSDTGGSSSSDCFISSLDAGAGSNFAWIAMIAILAVAAVLTVARRQKI